jgi:hypothetical protein
MDAGGIDETVRRFLAAHISSIGQLELLFFLDARADRAWSAEECSRELRSDLRWIQALLGDLAQRGFLITEGAEADARYRYAPSSAEVRALVARTAIAYKERRLSVTNLIHGKVESDAASFSAAFAFLKKKKGG